MSTKTTKTKKVENKQIAYAFIDSQNLNLGVKSQGWKLDWRKFRQYLRNKYNATKAYLFIGQVTGNEALYAFLQECGYILIFKPTLAIQEKGKVTIKGNVDAELVLHSMIQYKNYGKAIIVSGDGDFHCLVEYLVEKGKLLKILAPTNHYSSLLRKFNNQNYIVRIDLLRGSLEQKKTGIRVRSKP
ncbi:MAG: hypothetical protein COU26_03005 [Candidatus Levybacteria bacterium CG10_big_fil_rev_8_21_14_0_10_36_30]|nr:MAG: hypothetical protein COU26_03005 [Candidatus Levybacteria bacterium CG10_big_fil_rev_8_21_14_0_10_36_30]